MVEGGRATAKENGELEIRVVQRHVCNQTAPRRCRQVTRRRSCDPHSTCQWNAVVLDRVKNNMATIV